MFSNIKGLLSDEGGATLVEYGLLVALIAAVSIVMVGLLGQKILNAFSNTNAQMP
jgi:pilus assembly protein Flp/PilA